MTSKLMPVEQRAESEQSKASDQGIPHVVASKVLNGRAGRYMTPGAIRRRPPWLRPDLDVGVADRLGACVQRLIWYDADIRLFSVRPPRSSPPQATSGFALAIEKKSSDERYRFAITT